MEEENKFGRPSLYTDTLAEHICLKLTEGESLVSICSPDDMPNCSTVFRWLDKHEDFCNMYTRAREAQAELLADEIISIADDSHNDIAYDKEGNEILNREFVQRSTLRVEARKWVASKLKPKKYGAFKAVEHSGEIKSQTTDLSKYTFEQLYELKYGRKPD